MHDDVWRRAGFGESADGVPARGQRREVGGADRGPDRRLLQGHRDPAQQLEMAELPDHRQRHWRYDNVVLLGDAAHTAHFSIGSGTKLAMEDALALAACLHEHAGRCCGARGVRGRAAPGRAVHPARSAGEPRVVREHRPLRRPGAGAVRVQHRHPQPPRSPTTTCACATREFVADIDRWYAEHEALAARCRRRQHSPPMFQPFRLGALELKNRVVVSPMDMYSAVDGLPGDFHLVHLGARALGGAGLVMTEMVCVSPAGRITPGCAGIYTAEQEAGVGAHRRLRARASTAKIGLQLGHSGRKGSTKLMWEGMDEPLPSGNWDVVAPSALPYSPANQTPRELSRPSWTSITDRFRRCRRGGGAGRVRPARAALRPRIPAVVVPVAAVEPPHRRLRRLDREPAAVPAGGVRRGARGMAGRPADQRAHLGDRLVRGRQRRATRPS